MAKEACRKLYLQVKTLDREKSALETLSQSLNEENTTLKKLNESLTKNVDTSSSGMLRNDLRNEATCQNTIWANSGAYFLPMLRIVCNVSTPEIPPCRQKPPTNNSFSEFPYKERRD